MGFWKNIVAFATGLLFALGLGIGGMTLPAKVIGFLDITQAFGPWDSTLAFVMGGALFTYALFHRLALRHGTSYLAGPLQIPTRKDIDRRLIAGAALFGLGWGLGGFCPGPAIASTVSGAGGVLVFVAAMTAGMVLFAFMQFLLARRVSKKEPPLATPAHLGA